MIAFLIISALILLNAVFVAAGLPAPSYAIGC